MVKSPSRARALLAVFALAVGCQAVIGVEDKQLDPKHSQGDGAVDTSPLPPVPPDRPDGPAVPSGKGATRWFAARRIYLGSVDPVTEQSDAEAWKRIGHDIDGECTTLDISSSDTSATCNKPPNAAKASLEDGVECRDNAIGRLMSIGISQLSTDFEAKEHKRQETGETGTYLLRLDDLDPGPDDPWVRGVVYVTVPRNPQFQGPPIWDGSDELVVDVQTVKLDTDAMLPPPDAGSDAMAEGGALDASPDAALDAAPDAVSDAGPPPKPFIDQPLYVFDKGYVKDNHWVSGDFRQTPMAVPLFVFGRTTEVDAATVTLVARLSDKHDRIEQAHLSAVVGTSEIEAKFRPIALELALCIQLGATYMMDNFVLPARDLGMSPPSFQTQGVPCGAISLGWAFKFEPVKPPTFVGVGPYKATTCGG